MVSEDYVSYDVAKLLKEKGFPQKQENSGYYATEMVYCTTESKDGIHHFCHQYPACCDKKYEYICAPTLQMAMKWLREIHNIHIVIKIVIRTYGDTEYYYELYGTKNKSLCVVCDIYKGESWDSSEKACEVAIKYSLRNLI